MPARDEQQEIGEGEAVGETGGQRVRLEMIDRDEAECRAPSAIALAVVTPTISPPIRPGPRCRGDAVDLIERKPCLAQRLKDRGIEQIDMGARGDLRHDPAIDRMQIELRAHDIRQDLAAPVGLKPHDGGCGLVAARLDAEKGEGDVAGGRHRAFYRD